MPRTILITGGARGIGKGIAKAFLKAGDQVMIGDLGTQGRFCWSLLKFWYLPASDTWRSQRKVDICPRKCLAVYNKQVLWGKPSLIFDVYLWFQKRPRGQDLHNH